MSNPVLDLQKIFSSKTAMAGRVISVAKDVAKVATANGLVEVPCDETFSVGGRVTVRDGRAVRVQNSVDAPVHFV